ncbi:MAG: penicillin-binding protein 2, partial [Pseudomonadota bacterium]|nr:penicillin-binding protein 2 [Pseudomonadota bacterium]
MSTPTEQPQIGMQRWRFALVLAGFLLLGGVVMVRLVMLHTVDQPFLFEQGEKRTVRSETQPATRGVITDRFGEP